MSLRLSAEAPHAATTDVLALLVTQEGWEDQLKAHAGDLGADLIALAKQEGFEGKTSQQFSTATLGRLPARRIVLIGAGGSALSTDVIRDLGGRASKAAGRVKATSASVWAPWGDAVFGGDAGIAVRLIGEGTQLGAYRFGRYMTKDSEKEPLDDVALLVGDGDFESERAAAEAIVAGIVLARDLGNEPPQVCTPEHMAQTARKIAETYGFEATILDEHQIDEKGMNLLGAVGRGSTHDKPRFIHLKYTGEGPIERKMAFVGKGVTFDTGGYSLKISGSMVGMHLDMCGAAAVLGAAESIGRIKPAGVELHFIVPTASNKVSGEAYTVNEIILGYGGKTVEITNTDAEGRLCLADALAYATELDVDEIIDLATLTGACVVALGEQYTAVFSTDDAMASRVVSASKRAGERMWHMPLDTKLRDKLKSPVADMKNASGDRWGGAITAALFLKEWVGDVTWTHLDIAGPAFLEGDSPLGHKGGSGVGVATLVAYSLDHTR